MKKLFVILGILVLLLAVPMVSANPSLKASLLRYDPLPAKPGQLVTVYLKLENIGNSDAASVALRIKDQFPFSIIDEADRDLFVGQLKSQQSVVSDFSIRVDSAAFIGNNDFSVEFSEDTFNGEWQEASFPVDVQSGEVSLTITRVETSRITPGEAGTIKVTIKNDEDTVLRNIALQLLMVATLGTTTVDLPFIPLNSATEKRVSRLNPGELTTVTYDIKAYPAAIPGYYKLPLLISYVNDQGNKSQVSDYAGVVLDAVPELKILLDESTVSKEEMSGSITLKFINKGINDLKFLDSKLLVKEGYEVTSKSEDYIGDLDSDDYRSETYNVKITDEDVSFDVKVSYKDQNNKDYTQTISVPLRFSESLDNKSHLTTYVIIIVLLVAGFFYFRHKKKMRRK